MYVVNVFLEHACINRSSAMASPPCCPPNSTPALGRTPPFVGRVVDIESNGAAIKSYVTGSALEASTHIVIVFSDVFGYDSGRHFEFADHLSTLLNKSIKATVLVPDVFMGRPLFVEHRFLPEFVSGLLNIPSFVYRVRGGAEQFIDPIYNILFPWLAEQGVNLSVSSLSWVGFCFGGWLGCKVSAYSRKKEEDGKDTTHPAWTCGVGIHPALLPERVAGADRKRSWQCVWGTFRWNSCQPKMMHTTQAIVRL